MTDDELSDYITDALNRRMPHYLQASDTFCADWLDSRQMIDESVALFISRFNLPTAR